MNRFAFVDNRPIVARDSSGFEVEVLVGSSYQEVGTGIIEPYGHTAVRVFGEGYDYTYDFGRHQGSTGELGAEGPGILRRWTDFGKYISLQKSKGAGTPNERTTTGYVYATTRQQDKDTIRYLDAMFQAATSVPQPQSSRSGVVDVTRLATDYHGLFFNCTTLSVDAVEAGVGGDLDVASENQGRGLSPTEMKVARLRNGGAWPAEIFTPADLKKVLDAKAPPSSGSPELIYRVEQWNSSGGHVVLQDEERSPTEPLRSTATRLEGGVLP